MASKLVVVESPAKSRTLKKYLGKDFQVVSSVGHIIDLPGKKFGVDLKTFDPQFEPIKGKEKVIADLKKEMKEAQEIYLASDPDREGEAISYHLATLAPKGKTVHRVLFNAITREVVQDAIQNPTQIDQNKVESQFARRILDRLIGYTISPLLNRSLYKGLSAGRVQSAALRMVCDREDAIRAFIPQEYWKLEGIFITPRNEELHTELFSVNGNKLEDHPIADEAAMQAVLASLKGQSASAKEVKQSSKQQPPPKPLITSTLQQAASTELRLSSKQTMRLAQSLYENGHITYMRTDSTRIDPAAAAQAKGYIARAYGESYVGPGAAAAQQGAPKVQDAHEAIRPTDITQVPGSFALDADEARLYDLIWKRFVASQMAPAKLKITTVDVGMGNTIFRAGGSQIVFEGFYKVLKPEKEDKILPEVNQGEALTPKDLTPSQHFTEPPSRYSEAGLIRALEKEGIGRPSTYASIISVLTDREYVRKEKNHLIPTEIGEKLNTAMKNHFPSIVDLGFTAEMEKKLDDVESGAEARKTLVSSFYKDFEPTLEKAKQGLRDEKKAQEIETGVDCPKCGSTLIIKESRFGRYAACSKWAPKNKWVEGVNCAFVLDLPGDFVNGGATDERLKTLLTLQKPANEALGHHPDTSEEIFVKTGPYGPYVQLGAGTDKKKPPKRVSLPKGLAPGAVDYDTALKLLELPRTLGDDPATGKPIKAGLGRFGPYVQLDKTYASLKAGDDVLTVNLDRALQLINEKNQKGQALRSLGAHSDGQPVEIFDGRFGPYVKHGKINATLPKGADIEAITFDEALALLAEKAAKGPGKPVRKGGRKPAAKK